MVDIEKQISYWRGGAIEDWQVAHDLVSQGRPRHGLFFAHLALEKLLKAHVCKKTRDLAPRIHNLIKLAELASISLDQDHIGVLADLNLFNMFGRYPDMLQSEPGVAKAKQFMGQAEEVFQWLMKQL
jgi:HEPN domain-containing protein